MGRHAPSTATANATNAAVSTPHHNPNANKNTNNDGNDTTFTPSNIKVLLCSENVPPQVNGIARRIGHYSDGLRKMGCEVDLLHPESGFDKVLPHVNPWNFTARMMVIVPLHLLELVNSHYDVVHVVLPLNLSGMWLLAAFALMRQFSSNNSQQPTLVCSWHCNMFDYIQCHLPKFFQPICMFGLFDLLCGLMPYMSDRILTPTKATDPKVISMWKGRSGVCNTGIQKGSFSPCNKTSKWGMAWDDNKRKFLRETKRKHLLVCVGRLSPEKGTDELIKCLHEHLDDCALWLVGDGPHRAELEILVKELKAPVQFLGYQKGEALHAAYSIADVFVCPSLTETFGQTVNEALASKVRVALPSVPVFVEAYSPFLPKDAFWRPLDRTGMAHAITTQLKRHDANDPIGLPDLEQLKSWDDACHDLFNEYKEASKHHVRMPIYAAVFLPFWYLVTFFAAISIMYLAFVRTLFGGSVRFYFSTAKKRQQEKLKMKMRNLKQKIQKKKNSGGQEESGSEDEDEEFLSGEEKKEQ
jgi:glycosyltransferase involved in cell wall biosynthesis